MRNEKSNSMIKVQKYSGRALMLPKPYIPEVREKIKAIVLGCDPSSSKLYEKIELNGFSTVFDLEKPGENTNFKYFGIIKRELKKVFGSKDEKAEEDILQYVAVYNLCNEYLERETGKYNKKAWTDYVKENKCVDKLKESIKEFEGLPIFITSEHLVKPLTDFNENENSTNPRRDFSFKNCYEKKIIILPEENCLGRFLIPLSRCPKYTYDELYSAEIKKCIDHTKRNQ